MGLKDGLLTRIELAEYLNVTPRQVMNYLNQDKIPEKYIKIVGKRKYFKKNHVEDIRKAIKSKQKLELMHREENRKLPAKKKKEAYGKIDTNDSNANVSNDSNDNVSSNGNSKSINDFIEIEHEAAAIDADLFNNLKTMEQKYKAFKVKFEAEVLMKKHVPTDEVEEIWKNQLLVMKAKIQSIRGEIANLIKDFIKDPEDREIILKRIEEVQDEICTELSK